MVAKQSYLTDDIKIIHHIIRHIKKTLKPAQNSTCSLLTISEQEVKKILKELSTEKAGVDMIPPKLVKLLQITWLDLSHSLLTIV